MIGREDDPYGNQLIFLIAREINCSYDEVFDRMSGEEIDGWERHFEQHPPGDPYAQYLLAHVCAMISAVFGGKSVTYKDFMHWVREDSEQKEIKKKEQKKKTRSFLRNAALASVGG